MKVIKYFLLILFFFIYQFGEICQWLVQDGIIAWHWTFGYISNVGAILLVSHILYLLKINSVYGLLQLLGIEILQAFDWYTKMSYKLSGETNNSPQLNHYFDWWDMVVLVVFWMIYKIILNRLMKIS